MLLLYRIEKVFTFPSAECEEVCTEQPNTMYKDNPDGTITATSKKVEMSGKLSVTASITNGHIGVGGSIVDVGADISINNKTIDLVGVRDNYQYNTGVSFYYWSYRN